MFFSTHSHPNSRAESRDEREREGNMGRLEELGRLLFRACGYSACYAACYGLAASFTHRIMMADTKGPKEVDKGSQKEVPRDELAKKLHPDTNKDDADAERKFQEVQRAYEVLKDDEKWSLYDQIADIEGGSSSLT